MERGNREVGEEHEMGGPTFQGGGGPGLLMNPMVRETGEACGRK